MKPNPPRDSSVCASVLACACVPTLALCFCYACVTAPLLADAKGFQLVMIRFKPVYGRQYSGQLGLEINHSRDNCVKISTTGFGTMPKLTLPLNATVCIKPTCIGVTSTREYTIK